MMTYLLNGEGKENVYYDFSYKEMRDKYDELISLTDSQFRKRLAEALHFACFVCYVKEIPGDVCLSDVGVIHLLAHMMHFPKDEHIKKDFRLLRKTFEDTLKIS